MFTIDKRREVVAATSEYIARGYHAPQGDYVQLSRAAFDTLASAAVLVTDFAEILAPRQCPLCNVPLGEAICTHVNDSAKQQLRQVIMTETQWLRQVEIINDLRSRARDESDPLERIARALESVVIDATYPALRVRSA